jgi:hypothetical protein
VKKKIVEIAYKFEIKYEHEQHLADITNELKEKPIFEMGGAGIVEGKAYGYDCKKKGKGKVITNKEGNHG